MRRPSRTGTTSLHRPPTKAIGLGHSVGVAHLDAVVLKEDLDGYWWVCRCGEADGPFVSKTAAEIEARQHLQWHRLDGQDW